MNCLFVQNEATYHGGGAVSGNATDPVRIVNNTFVGNTTVTGSGGAVWLQAGCTAEIANNAFLNNEAAEGWSIASLSSAADVEVSHTVAFRANASNTVANHFSEAASTLTLDSQTCWLSDPAFVSPATGDHRPSTGSPCIDSGANPATFSGLESYLSVDLDGRARPRRGTDADIGSYEYYPN